MQTTTLKIGGMTCMGCVASVKTVLGKLTGVHQVAVSLEQATATIQHDSTKVSIDQLKAAIIDAGFEVVGHV
ncbi:MAG: heavy-metal-associated domain-containing protein [Pseudomonadota bacterium]